MVKGCKSCRGNKMKGISFHELPVNSRLRTKWLENIGFKGDPSSVLERGRPIVCGLHFAEECFRDISKGKERKLLNFNAIPTVFTSFHNRFLKHEKLDSEIEKTYYDYKNPQTKSSANTKNAVKAVSRGQIVIPVSTFKNSGSNQNAAQTNVTYLPGGTGVKILNSDCHKSSSRSENEISSSAVDSNQVSMSDWVLYNRTKFPSKPSQTSTEKELKVPKKFHSSSFKFGMHSITVDYLDLVPHRKDVDIEQINEETIDSNAEDEDPESNVEATTENDNVYEQALLEMGETIQQKDQHIQKLEQNLQKEKNNSDLLNTMVKELTMAAQNGVGFAQVLLQKCLGQCNANTDASYNLTDREQIVLNTAMQHSEEENVLGLENSSSSQQLTFSVGESQHNVESFDILVDRSDDGIGDSCLEIDPRMINIVVKSEDEQHDSDSIDSCTL